MPGLVCIISFYSGVDKTWPRPWPTLWPTCGRFFRTSLSIALNLCKQLAPSICHILTKAVTKHANHDKNLIRDDLRYTLLYPDGTEVKTLPGSSDCVILHKYKDEIGKSLSRVTLYIATKSDVSDALFSELEEKCTASENIISRCRGGNCFRQIAASAEF